MKRLFLFIMISALGITAFAQRRIAPQKTTNEILNEAYCTGLFSTPDAVYFDMLDDRVSGAVIGYQNVLDWLQGRVAGLNVYRSKYNRRIPIIRNQRAGVFVDEIPVDYDYLNMLPVTDIAMIKVIKGPFAHPLAGPGGAIAIYTIRGGDDEGETTE